MQSARLRLLANALAIAASRKRSQHKSQENLGLAKLDEFLKAFSAVRAYARASIHAWYHVRTYINV